MGRGGEHQGLGFGTTTGEGETMAVRWVERGISLQSDFMTVFWKWIQVAWEQTLLGSKSFFSELADREV